MPAFAEALLAWYDQYARDLPWRLHTSPYSTWVSEIMLQQTQVETVIPYFIRFMQRFPDLASLAKAEQSAVLQHWEGLGYYSRARNLHKSAQRICEEHAGQIPSDPKILRGLPGIGFYTAGAIASIAYGIRAPILDANVRRVYARVLNNTAPLGSPASEQALASFAREAFPEERVGDFNQALMELGALLCTPKEPRCPVCPIQMACQAFRCNTQAQVPVKLRKAAIPHYTVTAAVIQHAGRFLIAQRPQSGLLGGMWEFPGGKLEDSDTNLPACLRREIREELELDVQVGAQLGVFKHAYTHFKITLHAFYCRLSADEVLDSARHPNARWVRMDELSNYAMGKVDRLIAMQLMQAPR